MILLMYQTSFMLGEYSVRDDINMPRLKKWLPVDWPYYLVCAFFYYIIPSFFYVIQSFGAPDLLENNRFALCYFILEILSLLVTGIVHTVLHGFKITFPVVFSLVFAIPIIFTPRVGFSSIFSADGLYFAGVMMFFAVVLLGCFMAFLAGEIYFDFKKGNKHNNEEK